MIWNFKDAIYFAATVVTTIGYGSIAPSTDIGRIFVYVYGIFGIALFNVFCGAWITEIFEKYFYKIFKNCFFFLDDSAESKFSHFSSS